MFKQFWNLFCKFLLLAGILAGFLALVEIFRVFTILYRVHPYAGWGFAGAVTALVMGTLIYFTVKWRSLPRALKAPVLPAPGQASHRDMQRFCRYLSRYLRRLASNPNLGEEHIALVQQGIEEIEDVLGAHPLNDDLDRLIEKCDAAYVGPLLGELERRAAREVRGSVRDVMLGVTLSPYHSVDLLIVLYRNGRMVFRIARIYAGRPAPREQWLILRDTLQIVATVNFLHMGRNLLESLFSKLPVIGKIVEDIGEGLGAGLLTSASGHAAMDRCAAYRGWNRQVAAAGMAAKTCKFLEDVRDIFMKDVFPEIKGRIRSSAPKEKVDAPGFWDSIAKGVTSAIDATAGAVENYVVKPAFTGAQEAMRAGAAVTQTVVRAGQPKRRKSSNGHTSSRPRSFKRLFRTVGQRVKYRNAPR